MALAIDFNFVGPGQFGVAFNQGDATVDQQVAVNTVEAMDFAIFVGDQGRPVKIRFTQAPTKAGRLLEVFGEVCTVHQQLFRHAAHVYAGAAQVAAFGHGHLGTKPCSKTCCANTAGTGANYIQVKIEATNFCYEHFYKTGKAY